MNVVMTGSGSFIEIQGTAEGVPFSRAQSDQLLTMAEAGIANLVRARWLLSELAGEHLWVAPSGSGECETEGAGLRKNKLPGVSVNEVRGARQVSSAAPILAGLERVLAGVAGLTHEERTRVLARAADARA